MKLLINISELQTAASRDKFPLECSECKKIFYAPKNQIQCVLSGKTKTKLNTCSHKCRDTSNVKQVDCSCKQCFKVFKKNKSRVKNGQNHFCSQSCAATYNNTHKKHGTRRSKLEVWLQTELVKLYPKLEIRFNYKDAINSELDIYIPSLKLAFELNGIFHYEPIYGKEKLAQTQNNDERKFQACLDKQIELCIIDTSGQIYFKEKTSRRFLDIITKVIDSNSNKI